MPTKPTLAQIRERHPADDPGHACSVCEGEYGCAGRLSPYENKPYSGPLCDVAILLFTIEKLEKTLQMIQLLHTPQSLSGRTICELCSPQEGHYPCSTRIEADQALEGKLYKEEK